MSAAELCRVTRSVDIDSDNNSTAADNDKAHILQAGALGACAVSVNNVKQCISHN